MLENLRLIFDIYGGPDAVWRSSYLRFSFFLTILFWRPIISGTWPDLTLGIIPSVMGFSIAAVAIVTVIGDDGFRKNMAKVSTLHATESDLVVTLASFIWFILIQVSATVVALIFKSRPFPSSCIIHSSFTQCNTVDNFANILASALGMLLFIYAILLIIASVMQTFHLFRLYIRNPPKE